MAAKSKFFRVAVEGATTDGREIERGWIQQMAATYNRAKYGARVFAEHIRGVVPDGPFRALGDVLELKSEEIADGELKGKMALYAKIDPSDAMVKLIKSGQKIFSSIEIDHNFAGSDMAYLSGLGITDSPASLGTEVLTFAAQHPDASPFASRKQRPENLFSVALETEIELETEEAINDPDASASFFAKLQAMLDKFSGQNKPTAAAEPPEPADPKRLNLNVDTSDFAELTKAMATFGKQTSEVIATLAEQVEQHQEITAHALDEFRHQLDNTPADAPRRPAATGGTGAPLTDC